MLGARKRVAGDGLRSELNLSGFVGVSDWRFRAAETCEFIAFGEGCVDTEMGPVSSSTARSSWMLRHGIGRR